MLVPRAEARLLKLVVEHGLALARLWSSIPPIKYLEGAGQRQLADVVLRLVRIPEAAVSTARDAEKAVDAGDIWAVLFDGAGRSDPTDLVRKLLSGRGGRFGWRLTPRLP